MQYLNGYKKFIVAVLTIFIMMVSNFFGKKLDINVDQTADAVLAVISVGYMLAQTFHDIYKEKNKSS